MARYEAEVNFLIPDGIYTTVVADDVDDAEYQMQQQVLEVSPFASAITIENIKKIED